MLQTPSSVRFAPPHVREQLEAVYQSAELTAFQRGQPIPLSTEQVWLVRRGMVQLGTFYPNGEESLLGLAGPGMPFGLPLAQVNPYSAIALSDVLLLRLNLAELEQSALWSHMLFQHLTHRLQQTESLLAIKGYRRVEDRLRQFLLLLADAVGVPTTAGTRFNVRFTHQVLANATGTTRVTITRLLGQLKREGWLTFDPEHHIILLQAQRAQSSRYASL
jgi:CRP-like cAMP-binding protein